MKETRAGWILLQAVPCAGGPVRVEARAKSGTLTFVGDHRGLEKLVRLVARDVVVCFDDRGELAPLRQQARRLGLAVSWPLLSLKACLERLYPHQRLATPGRAAAFLGLTYYENEAGLPSLTFLEELFHRLRDQMEERGISTLEEMLRLSASPTRGLWHRAEINPELLRALPDGPGVYLMFDKNGEILYVGKARNLRNRVSSYFYQRDWIPDKIATLLGSTREIRHQRSGSELEALLLESRLIRLLHPPVNVQVEVHERPASYGTPRRLILIMPGLTADRAELFLVSPDRPLKQVSVSRESLDPAPTAHHGSKLTQKQGRRGVDRKILLQVKRFFQPARRPTGEAEEDRWIALSWLEQHCRECNFVDVDAAGDFSQCARLLQSYLKDPESARRKVIHI
ncbi:MAG: nucleotide excision repair endonuclease [Acidobacteria bacterium]|nr:nucleotide excision repair endonuclease [Acidobacteriota bacterium]